MLGVIHAIFLYNNKFMYQWKLFVMTNKSTVIVAIITLITAIGTTIIAMNVNYTAFAASCEQNIWQTKCGMTSRPGPTGTVYCGHELGNTIDICIQKSNSSSNH
jgi:hypothetical protein